MLISWQARSKKQEAPSEREGRKSQKGEEVSTGSPLECQRVMLQHIRPCKKAKINGPGDVVDFMREVKNYDRERGVILHLDTKNNVIGVENISTGSLNASIVHPREALKGAILNNSAHVIFAHNHPSGDPNPSAEDVSINRKLKEAFNVVGIDMLDSIIIGKDSYYSAKEMGNFGESKIMETNKSTKIEIEQELDDVCDIAISAALSVIKDRCGEPDEEVLETLEQQAHRLIEKTEKNWQPGLEKQLQFYKENQDAQGMLKFIEYLRTWVD